MAATVDLGMRIATYWFLASPYSKYPGGLQAAFEIVVRSRWLLVQAGIPCFSPIVHSHPVAMLCGINPYNAGVWLPAEERMRRCAGGIIMLRAETWERSRGMQMELAEFIAEGKPVVWMDPGTMPKEFAG